MLERRPQFTYGVGSLSASYVTECVWPRLHKYLFLLT